MSLFASGSFLAGASAPYPCIGPCAGDTNSPSRCRERADLYTHAGAHGLFRLA